MKCQSASDCQPEAPICDTASEACVECLLDADCANGVCDDGLHVCRPCTDDADCESGHCVVETGECGQNIADWKYLPTACDAPASNALQVSTAVTIDTSDVSQCVSGVVTQTDAPEICVLHYSTITIAGPGSIRFIGARAVALVADGDVSIAGQIDVGADATSGAAGPGGGVRFSGGYPAPSSAADPIASAGGGGGGFQTAGGSGGGSANAGAIFDPIAALVLVGGATAEPSTDVTPGAFRHGGGGGGGLNVISCNGKLTLTGSVNASGGGGGHGVFTTSGGAGHPSGGFGGGSGGNILFQGWEIEISGTFIANGGGGGSGMPVSTCSGCSLNPGGTPTLVTPCPPAATVTGTNPQAGDGGVGGCGNQPPTSGTLKTGVDATSGGGGGSVGFFRTAMPTGTPVVNPTMAQPAFSPNETVPRH